MSLNVLNRSKVPLMEDICFYVTTIPSADIVQSVKAYYTRNKEEKPDAANLIYEGSGIAFVRQAIKPGYWYAKADVVIGGKTYTTNTVEVCEEFPDASTILAAVSSDFDNLWTMTKDYARNNASSHLVREYGAWVFLDTATGQYSVEGENGNAWVEGQPVALVPGGTGKVEVSMSKPYDDWNNTGDPKSGGKFVVANFHTHYPICYALVNAGAWIEHICGPTKPDDYDAVNRDKVPGFVYDYSKSRITNRHKIDDPAQVYTYGNYNKRDSEIRIKY